MIALPAFAAAVLLKECAWQVLLLDMTVKIDNSPHALVQYMK